MNIIETLADSSTFLVVAGIASILAFTFVVLAYTRKKLREFKENLENAERDFDERISKLKSTGGSVSARTDLGFLVLFELGTFRDFVHSLYNMTLFAAIMSTLTIVVYSANITAKLNSISTSFMCLWGYAGAAWLFASMLLMLFALHVQKKIWKYERRIKEVWVLPVEKRMPSDNDSKSE